MAGFIDDNIINEILNRVNIVEVISEYIPLKRAGRNFKTTCPFHHEKTASFMVSPDKQIYHCFGCFPPGSLIKTEKGFHKIEDVQTGQLVFTHRGRFMPIIRTLWRHYDGELIEIYTRKSSLLVSVTADHEIFAIKTKNCKYKSKESRICQWRCKLSCPAKFFKEYKIQKIAAKELTLNDYLLYPVNKKINDIKFIDLDKYCNRKVSNFGPDIKAIPTKIEIDERFLKLIGYWIAEGSNHRAYIRFSLGDHEREFAREITELVESIFNIKPSIHIRKGTNKTGLEITACNSKLSNIFENLCGKGAENKHIPFEFQDLSSKLQRIILDAIFKGDGYIGKVSKSKTNRKFKAITTVSLVLAEQLKDILLRIGISPTFTVEKAKLDRNNVRHRTAYTILWQEDIKLHFSDIIKINNILYQIVPIRKIITKKFIGDVYNLTVAEDHSYATPNFVVGNCGTGGNAFNFLMQYERMDFPEAVELLAKKSGVVLPEKRKVDTKAAGIITQLYKINELASQCYSDYLNSSSGHKARDYLVKRGIKQETAQLFKLGFVPDKWDALINHARDKFINLSLLEKAGLVLPKEEGGYYDRFRNRIIFPISDVKSAVLGFGARVMDDSLPKYINSPETPVYIKGRNLYGLNLAKESVKEEDSIVVVEGYLDCIVPYQLGLRNIVASLGTALTTEQARLIKRYTHNVVMVYDGDAAGQMATLRSLDIFIEEAMNVRVVALPEGYDPDSFVRKNGIDSLKTKIKNSEGLFDYKMGILKSRFDIKHIESKAKVSSEMLPTINKFKNAILKSEYIKRLAGELNISEDALLQESKKIKQEGTAFDLNGTTFKKVLKVNPTEKLLLKLMLEENELISQIKERIEPGDFQDEKAAKVVSLMFELISQGKNALKTNFLINYLDDEDVSQLICESTFDSNLLPRVSSQDKEKIVEDCIQRLKKKSLELKKHRLGQEIKMAERSGDEATLNRLKHEINYLIKQR